MKGQAAVMDGLIFMLIASGAATLLLFTSSLYATSTNSQIVSIYNQEYGGNALVALHYAKDYKGGWFWNELRGRLDAGASQTDLSYYLSDASQAKQVFENLTYSSPAGENTYLCFKEIGSNYCCGKNATSGFSCLRNNPPDEFVNRTVYTSSVKITSDTTIFLKLFY